MSEASTQDRYDDYLRTELAWYLRRVERADDGSRRRSASQDGRKTAPGQRQ
jgi:hypothetical protein